MKGEDLAGNRIDFFWDFTTYEPVTGLGSVTGRVVDSNGDPIAGARIKLDTGEETTTDDEGRFSIIGPVGEHEIRISASGYKDKRITVTILEGEEVVMDDIKLPKDTFPYTGCFPIVQCTITKTVKLTRYLTVTYPVPHSLLLHVPAVRMGTNVLP